MFLLLNSAFAGTSLSIESISADGQEVRNLSCTLDSGGFLALAMVVGSVAKQKSALDACYPAGEAVEVQWTWVAGKATEVSVLHASQPTQNACVANALKLTTNGSNGTCKGTLLIGASAGATAGLGAMK